MPYLPLKICKHDIVLGNKLFGFPNNEVDFYLPQLINMYIQMEDVAEVIHPYLIHR